MSYCPILSASGVAPNLSSLPPAVFGGALQCIHGYLINIYFLAPQVNSSLSSKREKIGGTLRNLPGGYESEHP